MTENEPCCPATEQLAEEATPQTHKKSHNASVRLSGHLVNHTKALLRHVGQLDPKLRLGDKLFCNWLEGEPIVDQLKWN